MIEKNKRGRKLIKIQELLDEFPKATIIDFQRKEVIIIKDKKFKCYNHKYFNELVSELIPPPIEDEK